VFFCFRIWNSGRRLRNRDVQSELAVGGWIVGSEAAAAELWLRLRMELAHWKASRGSNCIQTP